MPATKQSNIGLWQGWSPGEDGWGDEMNYNLRSLDALVQAFVLGILAAPPGSPSAGDSYIVGSGGTGAFSGQDDKIARYDGSAWEFYPSKNGWRVFNQADNAYYRHVGGTWQLDTAEAATGSTLAVRTPNGQINVANPTSGAHSVNRDYADSNYEKKRQNNLTATTDPGATDDASAGYEVLSRWVNTASGEIFICLDATNGSASWGKATLTLDELGSAALADVGTAGAQVPTNADLNISDWDTAYSWGDHAAAGYASDSEFQPVKSKVAVVEAQQKFDERATLILDYANNRYERYSQFEGKKTELASAIETFSRGSAKTGFTPTGLAEAGADIPLNVIDPATGEPLGRSIHGQRANLITNTTDYTSRSSYSSTSISVSNLNPIISGYDTFKMSNSLVIGTADKTTGIIYSADVGSGETTYSALVRYITGSGFCTLRALAFDTATYDTVVFNLDEGVIAEDSSSIGRIESKDNGYFLISITFDVNSADTAGSVYLINGVPNDDNSQLNELEIAHDQLENGSFPSPVIKTNGTQETRQADDCLIEDIDADDWWNPNEGTIVLKASYDVGSEVFANNRFILEVGLDSNNRFLVYNISGKVGVFARNDGVNVSGLGANSSYYGSKEQFKVAIKYSNSDLLVYIDGEEVGSVTWTENNPFNKASSIGIGYSYINGNAWLFGTINQIKYRPQAVSDEELLLLSTTG